MTSLIIEDLKKGGCFFNTPRGYFYFKRGEEPKLVPIEKGSISLTAFIEDEYGINQAERTEFHHLLTGMVHEAFLRGQVVDVHRMAHYIPETGRLYVSRFDGFVYRLDGKRIKLVHNGHEGVFFWDDPNWEPYEILSHKTDSTHLEKVILQSANFNSSGALKASDQRWVLRMYLYSQFFDSLHPTKPLLLICGEKGGGKSFALKKWLQLLFGQKADVTALQRKKPDDFVAAVCSQPTVVFDNVDEKISWLPDHLAQLATGVTFRMRKYYTTNTEVEFKPQCWVALTSRTPKFIEGRDDVLDRTLILRTDRLPKFVGEEKLLREMAENRNLLWTELLWDLNQIVAFIKDHDQEVEKVEFRMADFATFAFLVEKSKGLDHDGKPARILKRMEERQTEMLLQEEPIAVCLEEWLSAQSNHGKRVTSGDLQKELLEVAAKLRTSWPYTNGHSLGQRLGHIVTNLSHRFTVKVERDSARQWLYRFWPKD